MLRAFNALIGVSTPPRPSSPDWEVRLQEEFPGVTPAPGHSPRDTYGEAATAQLAQARQTVRELSTELLDTRKEARALLTPAQAALRDAVNHAGQIITSGPEAAIDAAQFAKAAALTPVIAPVFGAIHSEPPPAQGAVFGAVFGVLKAGEFASLTAQNLIKSLTEPVAHAAEAVTKSGQALWLAAAGSPEHAGRLEELSERLTALTEARAQALARLPALESRLAEAFGAEAVAQVVQREPISAQRTALGFNLDAGAGHKMATQAYTDALGKGWRVKVVEPYDKGDLYNWAQVNFEPQVLDWFGVAQKTTDSINDFLGVEGNLYGKKIGGLIREADPDLLVSVIPMGNATSLREAKSQRVPFVGIPTDFECPHFYDKIHTHEVDEHFKIALPFPESRDQYPHLPDSCFVITGSPVRRAFALDEPVETGAPRSEIVRELGIKPEDKVVLIMMGGNGAGAEVIRRDAQVLADELPSLLEQAGNDPSSSVKPGQKVHVIALCGGNRPLLGSLTPLAEGTAARQVEVHAVGPKEAHDLVALETRPGTVLMFMKPGGGSAGEVEATGQPVAFHEELHKVPWEAANARKLIDDGLGRDVAPDRIARAVIEAIETGRPQDPPDCAARRFPSNFKALADSLVANSAKPQLDGDLFNPGRP
jgi:hypothetical protein